MDTVTKKPLKKKTKASKSFLLVWIFRFQSRNNSIYALSVGLAPLCITLWHKSVHQELLLTCSSQGFLTQFKLQPVHSLTTGVNTRLSEVVYRVTFCHLILTCECQPLFSHRYLCLVIQSFPRAWQGEEMGEGTPASSKRIGSMAGEVPPGLRHCLVCPQSCIHHSMWLWMQNLLPCCLLNLQPLGSKLYSLPPVPVPVE